MQKKQRTFICGMSRGGTTWLGCCLNEHPEVAVFGETLFWGRYFVEPNADGAYGTKEIDSVIHFQRDLNKAFYGDTSGCLKNVGMTDWHQILDGLKNYEGESPGVVFDYLAEHIGLLEKKPLVIEKTPHHLNHISRIEESYPDSRYIVMVRDPYSFMLSYKYQGLQRSAEHRKHMARYFHPIGCALVWKAYAFQAISEISRLGDRATLVRFEELRTDSQKVWTQVLEFLDIKQVNLPIVKDKNSSFSQHTRPELDAIDIFWINFIAKDLISKLGYEKHVAKASIFSIAASLYLLIPCAVRVLREISSRSSGNIFAYVWNWVRLGNSGGTK